MKRILWACFLTLALCATSLILADARADLRIETERDEERNVTYMLKNIGTRTIEAKVEMVKNCTGTPRKVVTTYWVNAGASTKIGREWSETSCERDYSIVEAEYR